MLAEAVPPPRYAGQSTLLSHFCCVTKLPRPSRANSCFYNSTNVGDQSRRLSPHSEHYAPNMPKGL